MNNDPSSPLLSLELDSPIWDRFFSVAPLVLIGTTNADGSHDLCATYRAIPVGPENLFAFLASPDDAAADNARRDGCFTVSFPRPEQVVQTSVAAVGTGDRHPLADQLPVTSAKTVDGGVLEGAWLYLECEVERAIDDLGSSLMIIGRIVAAYLDREARRLAERDDYDLLMRHPLLAFVAPGRFAEIKHTDAFPSVE